MSTPAPVGSSATARVIEAFQAEGLETFKETTAEAAQVQSQILLGGEAEDIINITAKFEKTLAPKKSEKVEKAEKAQESVLIRKEEADGLADNFSKREGNRQYHLDKGSLSRLLQTLGNRITEQTELADIAAIIRDEMTMGGQEPDVGQVDKTFDFLIEVLKAKLDKAPSAELKAPFQALYNRISAAKDQYFAANQQAIEEAHHIIDIADIIVQQGKLETPETLSHLRDIIHNPQDLTTKFNYYRSKGYTYREIKQELDALLHFMGSELKRHEIPVPEMDTLIKETKRSQAILQIFRYFKKAAALGDRLFDMQNLPKPKNLNFELYSILFMKLVDERYPSSEKILQLTPSILAIAMLAEDSLEVYYMKIIILGLIRDAIKEVSPTHVYRSLQHRDDLYLAIIESLEELEDVVEEKEVGEEGEQEEVEEQKK